MITVEPWVTAFLYAYGYLPGNFRTVFIAENAPNPNTYFYRSVFIGGLIRGGNPFFNNLCNSVGVHARVGETELDRLIRFLDQGYILIDAFQNGIANPMLVHRHPIDLIYDDIIDTGVTNIMFIKDSNQQTALDLIQYDILVNVAPRVSQLIVPDFSRGRVSVPFPNWPAQVLAFNNSIQLARRIKCI